MKYLMSFCLFILISITLYAPTLHANVSTTPVANQLENILSKHQGQVVYLDFWASWCVPCRKSFPWMREMQDKYGKNGFSVISINVDKEKQLASKFLQQNPANFPVIYDPAGSLAAQYDLLGMPTSFLLDKQGKTLVKHTGFFTNKTSRYEQQIIAAMAMKKEK